MPVESTRQAATSYVIGIMSKGERRGRWRAGEHLTAFAFWGGCEIDLRGAEIEGGSIEVDAVAIMGGIDIVVPEGIKVELTGVPIMGGCSASGVKDVPVIPGTPVVRIRGVAFWGGIAVRSRPSLEEEKRRREERRLRREEVRGRSQQRHRELRRPPGQEAADRAIEHLERANDIVADRLERVGEKLDEQIERVLARHEARNRRGPAAAVPAEPAAPPDRPRRTRAVAAGPGAAAAVGPTTAPPDSLDGSIESVADAVNREQPDLSPEAMPDGTLTILFTDIEESTSMIERLGDLKAQEVIHAHNQIVRAQVGSCGGHEVKSQGDSFMVTFAGARRGVRCAIGIQRAFEDWCEKHPEQPISVRIGLHTGEALREAHDLFGKSVIMAARIAAQAGGGEILVSSLLKELTDSSGEFVFQEPRPVALKGLSGQHTVYPVDWREDDLPPILSGS